jgi:hypothetical protein
MIGTNASSGAVAAPAPVGDVLMLLHGDDSEDVLLDSSNYGRSPSGGSANYSASGIYSGCIADPTSLSWSIAEANSAENFCLEFYINISAYALGGATTLTATCFGIQLWFASGNLTMLATGDSDLVLSAIPVDTWTFVRLTRNGTTNVINLYINGSLVGTRQYNRSFITSVLLQQNAGMSANAVRIDEHRVSKNGDLGAGMPTFPF